MNTDNQDMHESCKNGKRERFGEFMRRLAEEPVLKNNPGTRFSMQDILREARYPVVHEAQYDYEYRELVPAESNPVIDMALLLTLLFQEKGLNCTSDDLMGHILGGGSFEQFMQLAYEKKGLEPRSGTREL